MTRNLFYGLTLFLTMTVLTADIVKEDAKTIVYRQPDTREITVPKRPERVVICSPSLSKVWALAGGKAVGVPDAADRNALPETMRNLPSVGSAVMPNLEKIVTLQPDLVLLIAKVGRHRAIGKLLLKTGIPAVCVEYNNYGDFHKLLDFFCKLNGREIADVPEARNTTGEVRRICERAREFEPQRCAVLFASASGFTLESRRTNTGMIAEMLGAVNISKQREVLRVHFSSEQLLLDNPDIIFIVTMGNAKAMQMKFRKDFINQPAWKTLKAAKNGRIHFLPSELFLYMPGPDYPKAFRTLANLLYPGGEFKK